MTAITLNLLAEEQLAQRAEARDPFKVTLAGGLALITICVVTGMWLSHTAEARHREAEALQAKCDSESTAASADVGSATKTVKSLADDIIAINHSRVLFAQQIALVKDLVPDSVQLERLNFMLSLDATEPAKTEPTEASTDKGKPARPARAKSAERLNLQLTGKAVSARPEIEVDQFIRSLTASPDLGSRMQEVKLRSIARNGLTGDTRGPSAPSASFVIDCRYKEPK